MKVFSAVAAVIIVMYSSAMADGAGEATTSPAIRTVAYPLAMYTPENSFMLGGGAVMVARRGGAAVDARPANLTINAIYTLKNQTVLQLLPEFYSADEKYKFRATILYQDMPTSFFGIGNRGSWNSDRIKALEEKYTNRAFIFQPQVSRKVWGELRAGLTCDLKSTRVADIPRGGSLAGGGVRGSSGGRLAGAGVMLEYDTRDNLFFPFGGVYAQAAARFYRGTLGSDYSYDYYLLDIRRYVGLGGGKVLGLQFMGVAAGRGVPFYDMPLYDLRGIYNTYFTDRASYYAQMEYRFPLKRRFSAVTFAGAGNSAPEADKLSFKDMQIASGAGLRFVLDEKERINMRLDVGASRWGVQPYFGITESF